MIAALVTFENVNDLSRDDAEAKFNQTAPNYRGRDGLISKAYIFAEDGSHLGGFYLWESKDHAESQYSPEWIEKASEIYDVAPKIQYYEVPVFIENVAVQSTWTG
ncbi:MAG: monooxygenase [Chloroflexota bacterium]